MNGPTKFVFDTNTAIEEIKTGRITKDNRADVRDAKQFTSVVVRMELLAKPGLPPDELAKIRAFLGSVTVVPLTEEIEEEAAAIRLDTRLKLPDAIVAATAVKVGAVLLTNDGVFTKKRVSGLTVQSII